MALPSSGPMRLSQVLAEFGRTGPTRLSDLYRGGSVVREKASDSLATNLAAKVPTSGPLRVSDFRGTEKGFRYTLNVNSEHYSVMLPFGSDWSVNYPKTFEISANCTIGSTNTGWAALLVNADGAGPITVINRGEIQGQGGEAGLPGGYALVADTSFTLYNHGAIRSGGGGGGRGGTGGTGGPGHVPAQYGRDPASGEYYLRGAGANTQMFSNTAVRSTVYWPGLTATGQDGVVASMTIGAFTYYRGTLREDIAGARMHGIYRTWLVANGYNTSGGAGGQGGIGGRGQGYQGGRTEGSPGAAGAAGGANAGRGGSGGWGNWGGLWGQAGLQGATGNAGAAGNAGAGTPGSAGSPGGAARPAIWQRAGSLTLAVTGTINGTYP